MWQRQPIRELLEQDRRTGKFLKTYRQVLSRSCHTLRLSFLCPSELDNLLRRLIAYSSSWKLHLPIYASPPIRAYAMDGHMDAVRKIRRTRFRSLLSEVRV